MSPHVQFKSNMCRLLNGVQIIEKTRKDVLFTRVLKKKHFFKQFWRELMFLRDFFGKRKNAAGKAIHKALKKLLDKEVK